MRKYFTCMIGWSFLAFPNNASARFCEGGHRCTPPKECCLQGCCYLYAHPGPPRSPAPTTDNVLNLFFVNHWYFWCVVAALVLAVLCACTLWKRRRTLCGWRDFREWGVRARDERGSEQDSAGSCYLPPQYSRCSSFHHAPPPYTEVTSKPDLYPLVFSYTGEGGGKGGASYLMVQYFRNYIVRPAGRSLGSLSATSTVDSLSSSFICTANEANTLIPPPYSRSGSPDDAHHHVGGPLPRSASSLVCRESPRSSTPLRLSGSTQFQTQSSKILLHNYLNNNGTEGSQNQHSNRNNQNPDHVSHSNYSLQQLMNTNGTSNTNINFSNRAIYDSCNSIGGSMLGSVISAQIQQEPEPQDMDGLRRSLDTCCQILQQRQIPCSQIQSCIASAPQESGRSRPSRVLTSFDSREFGTQPNFHDLHRSYSVATTTGSDISSLANVGTPDSPPRATSPTIEVRELLDKIRKLQCDQTTTEEMPTSSMNKVIPAEATPAVQERPSTLSQLRKIKYFNKSAKALYTPLNNGVKNSLKSPVGLFVNQRRRGWVSRSAPSTPSSALPDGRFGDVSPLLAEHVEEAGTDEML